MNASINQPNPKPSLKIAQLAASIGVIIPQAITMQRSLKSPGILDFVGIGACWIVLPILVTLAWFKWRGSRFTTNGDALCLTIGALLQSAMIVAWPATIIPSTLFFWSGGTLVTLTGGWIQSAIIGIALCLGLHAIAFSALGQEGKDCVNKNKEYFALAIGVGTVLGGLGLLLATYFGWTMYLLPSIMVWLALGIFRFYQVLSMRDNTQSNEGTSQPGCETFVPNGKDGAARLSGWAGTILAIFPLLLLSMNFQRQRYAAGYGFPLILVGIVSAGCVLIYHVIFKRFENRLVWFIPGWYGGLIIAILIDAGLIVPLILSSPEKATEFFKSWIYLLLTCISVVSCLPAIGNSLSRLSSHGTYHKSPGRAFGRIFFSGTLLAVIVVVFLLEGTSMIFSWEFGETETWIVTTIAVGLGGLFLVLAIGLEIAHRVKEIKEMRRKWSIRKER